MSFLMERKEEFFDLILPDDLVDLSENPFTLSLKNETAFRFFC